MSKPILDKAYEDAIIQIKENIAEFRQKHDARTSDPNNFITLSEIEEMWRVLNNSTSKTYSDMISTYLSEIDEKMVIHSKKDNTESLGSG